MKIIHTSDWHLGQNYYGYDREDEHRHFFGQLAGILRKHRPDALVVSGDVYHNPAPPIPAQKLFVESVMALHDAAPGTVIVITAGNHDSGSRLEVERQLWRRLGIYVVGSCTRRTDGTFDPTQFVVPVSDKGYVLAVPYFHTSNYPLASVDTDRGSRQRDFFDAVLGCCREPHLPVVMTAHLAVEHSDITGHEDVPVGGMLTEKVSDLGEGYDYLALGHIHMPQRISERVYYSGSPMPMSFSEDYDHYVNLVEIDAHGDAPRVTQIRIEPLRRVRTIPRDGAPLEDALNALQAYSDGDDSYVRVLVDQDERMPADTEDRARKIAQDKACRFCEVRRKPREVRAVDQAHIDVSDIADVKSITPREMALRSYERKNSHPMSPELVRLIDQAISLSETQRP